MATLRLIPAAFASLALLAACSKAPPPAPAVVAPPPPVTTPASLHLGEPLSAPTVTLTDVVAHPASYAGKPFTTTGTVTAVCQEMGCWMEMKDDNGQAHIRMHGHAFYVPKTAPGHHVRVQATLVPAKDEDTECTEEAKKQMGHAVAKVELDATGVEID